MLSACVMVYSAVNSIRGVKLVAPAAVMSTCFVGYFCLIVFLGNSCMATQRKVVVIDNQLYAQAAKCIYRK